MPKGLPKRVRNEKAKAKRARSWARNAAAKAIRIAEAQVAFEMNQAFRDIGEPTPYELRRQGQRILYRVKKSKK